MATLVKDAKASEPSLSLPREVTSLTGEVVAGLASTADVTTQSKLAESARGEVLPLGSSEAIAPETISSGERARAPPVSVDGLPKKLLILDVNGFLIDTMFKYDKGRPNSREHDGAVNNFLIYNRPHCEDFIKFCLDNFVVGVWSSARRHNVEGLTRYIFGDAVSQLAFIWGQDQCTNTGFMHPENPNKPIFLKELRKVWETPPFLGVYGPSNTLLIDDSAYKALRNPPYTGVFPKTYHADGPDQDCLAPTGRIRSFLEGIHLAADVREYVKANPFGQPGISVAPDCSVEITGEVDAHLREKTRASFEQFICQQRARRSLPGAAAAEGSSEGLPVGFEDGLTNGPAGRLAEERRETGDRGAEPGARSGFRDGPSDSGRMGNGWEEGFGGGGQGATGWGCPDVRREPPRHATGEEMNMGGWNGATWHHAENGGQSGRENVGSRFQTHNVRGGWQEAGPSVHMSGQQNFNRNWSEEECVPGEMYRERTRSPVGERRAWDGHSRLHGNGERMLNGDSVGRADVGWGPNGEHKAGWKTGRHSQNGWGNEMRPVNGGPPMGYPQKGTGWGQQGSDSGRPPFSDQRLGFQEQQSERRSHWAAPASQHGVNWRPEEAQNGFALPTSGPGWRPGQSQWGPSTIHHRSWEPSTGYLGPGPPVREAVLANGFDRNGWEVTQARGDFWQQQVGIPHSGWQSGGPQSKDVNGRVPPPPFRNYDQVTDPQFRTLGVQARYPYVSQQYRD